MKHTFPPYHAGEGVSEPKRLKCPVAAEVGEVMLKTTPRPWYVSGVRGTFGSTPVLSICREDGRVVAYIPYSDRTLDDHHESHGDAALIVHSVNATDNPQPDARDAVVEAARAAVNENGMDEGATLGMLGDALDALDRARDGEAVCPLCAAGDYPHTLAHEGKP